jgi:hypothetical protein
MLREGWIENTGVMMSLAEVIIYSCSICSFDVIPVIDVCDVVGGGGDGLGCS